MIRVRTVANIFLILGLALFVPACGGGGGGNGSALQSSPPPPTPPPPPSPPPSAACDGFFPGMVYEKPDTGPDPAGIYLASSDGCRSEFVYDSPDRRAGVSIHVTDDLSDGVLVWSEEPGNNGQHIMMRQDFSVAQDGALTLDPPVQILPRPGQEPAAGDEDFFQGDLWGGPTADMRYLNVSRIQVLASANGEDIREFLIYDLNDLSNVREVYRYVDGMGTWDCPAVTNPQFVAACYLPGSGMLFNPSGTRLYMSDNADDAEGQRWDGTVRIDVTMTGDPADWTFGEPTLVFTAPSSEGPAGALPRPGADRFVLPDPEIVGSAISSGSPTNVVRTSTFLDADQCADVYAPLSDGNQAGQADLWMQCVDDQFVAGDRISAWQSPDTVLTVKPPESPGIYRFHASGALAGTEEILIENGETPDTGL